MVENTRSPSPQPPRTRTQRAATRLTHILGAIYSTTIGLLIPLAAAYYFLWIRPKLRAALLASHISSSAAAGTNTNTAVATCLYLYHTLLSLLLLVSAVANYWALLTVRAGSPSADKDAVIFNKELQPVYINRDAINNLNNNATYVGGVKTASQTWRYCDICCAAKPPRSHHCRVCNRCFMRHCHHCPALGRCVGMNNYPYYFRFLSTAFAAAALMALTAIFILRANIINTSTTTRNQAVADTLLFTVAISAAVAAAVGVLLLWHVYLLVSGQTTIEVFENWAARTPIINNTILPPKLGKFGRGRFAGPFSNGLKANIIDAFGEPPRNTRFIISLPWWSVLLLPLRRKFHINYNLCSSNVNSSSSNTPT